MYRAYLHREGEGIGAVENTGQTRSNKPNQGIMHIREIHSDISSSRPFHLVIYFLGAYSFHSLYSLLTPSLSCVLLLELHPPVLELDPPSDRPDVCLCPRSSLRRT